VSERDRGRHYSAMLFTLHHVEDRTSDQS
jgi:hypothetical protein